MKKALKITIILIPAAIVLAWIIYNAYIIAVFGINSKDFSLDYECFGGNCKYSILDRDYVFFREHEKALMHRVYSYAVSGHYVFLYGEDAPWRSDMSPIYVVADVKTGLFFKYKNLNDSPVEFREHLAKLPTHPTLPESDVTQIKKKYFEGADIGAMLFD
jgi:hypothetical protein